jgi:LysM repeat protein
MKQNENYITVTVQEGESLWGIADALSAEHNLTKHEFIAWVEKENGIKNGLIYPGDKLVVPIMTLDPDSTTFVAGIDVE